MGRYAKAEPLYLQALEIRTKVLPKNHPYIQSTWDDFRYLIQQALQAGQAATLSPHPTTRPACGNWKSKIVELRALTTPNYTDGLANTHHPKS